VASGAENAARAGDTRVDFDSNWLVNGAPGAGAQFVYYGNFFLFQGTGVIPGGTQKGGTWQDGYLYSNQDLWILANDDSSKEKIQVVSASLSIGTALKDQNGQSVFTINLIATDKNGNVGKFISTSRVDKDPTTGALTFVEAPVVRF
jgi:hypothetical protein